MATTSDWVSLEGPFSAKDIRSLSGSGRIERLSLTKQSLVTAKISEGLSSLPSVEWLWVWCPITRTAMRHVVAIPQLEVLDVLKIRHPGQLVDFSKASSIRVFRCNSCMTAADLKEVALLPNLVELGAQSASISCSAVDAILRAPKLQKLDLEDSNFDDVMAEQISNSATIEELDVAGTSISRRGLERICSMPKLRSLDIWALALSADDLGLLTRIPNLEYLSLGHHELKSRDVLPVLEALPSLKRLWLDGVALSSAEVSQLEERYEYFRADAPG